MSQDATESNREADAAVLQGCRMIATGADCAGGLRLLQQGLGLGGRADNRENASGLRPVDIVARGLDGPEAAAAMESMAEGFAQAMMQAPAAMEMPPMMAACHAGNAQIVKCLLDLGMPVDQKCNAPKHKLMGATPFHATVVGYRDVRKEDYANVLRHLLTCNPEAIGIPDRLGNRPIELAFKALAITKDRTLVDAMLEFGVELTGKSEASAAKLAQVFINRGDETLRVQVVDSHAQVALREVAKFKAPRS